MRWNMFFGALILSVGLCSQSFGFELLDRMLGYGGGCGCEPSCCAKPCCAKPCCPKPCCAKPCCPKPCCAKPCCKSRCGGCDLFGGLNGLFCCKSRCGGNRGCGCQPSCAAPQDCGCAKSCCKSRCRHRCGCGLLDIFRCHKSRCGGGCGCGGGCDCGGGGEVGPVPGPPADGAVPMPPDPTPDPSARIESPRRVVRAASSVIGR